MSCLGLHQPVQAVLVGQAGLQAQTVEAAPAAACQRVAAVRRAAGSEVTVAQAVPQEAAELEGRAARPRVR